MNKLKTLFLTLTVLIISFNLSAQELKVETSSSVNIEELPEYVIITSENTKLLGGINIIIDYKKSSYKKALSNLEDLLQDGDKLRVRNQTDLLNSMSKLGYEYIDGYNSGATSFGDGKDDYTTEDVKFRINMVFRKKEAFRN